MLDYSEFKSCSSEYRTAPFWSWNGKLEKDELIRQINEMNAQGIGGFFMHPRGGMKDEYLGESYLDAVRVCVEEAEKLGMKAWLYDEDRFPSGCAAGRVTRDEPSFYAKALSVIKVNSSDFIESEDNIKIFAHKEVDDGELVFTDVTNLQANDIKKDFNQILVCKIISMSGQSLWNNEPYTDLCNKDAVDRFIELTHEKYRQHFGEYFGNTIPGIFTDEPHFNVKSAGEGSAVWTQDFDTAFQSGKGYSLLDNLPKLFFEYDDYKKVRFDYWDVLAKLFVNNFTKNIYDWCDKNDLIFTGHFWDHEFPNPYYTGAVMPNYEYMHYPGIDMLFNSDIDKNQFGNNIIVKELSSVKNQLSKARAISETYGASGWELNFIDQKKVADWQAALGVDFVCQHLVHYSLEGYRKRDFPLSFLDHQPWWEAYNILGEYTARLSYALSKGRYKADLLVLNPTSSTWSEYNYMGANEELASISKYAKWINKVLPEMQIGYDIGDETILQKHGKAEGGYLTVGLMKYSVILLPYMSTITQSTFELLKQFVQCGGKIISVAKNPDLIEGVHNPELVSFMNNNCIKVLAEKSLLLKTLLSLNINRLNIEELDNKDMQNIYVNERHDNDSVTYFLCNISKTITYKIKLYIEEAFKTEEWDLTTGEKRELPIYKENGKFFIMLDFMPVESHLVILDKNNICIPKTLQTKANITHEIILNNWQAERKDFNAYTLQVCQYKINDDNWSEDIGVVTAFDEVRKSLGFESGNIFMRQPWMYSDEDKKKKANVYVKYQFFIAEDLTKKLYVAAECANETTVFINGIEVSSTNSFYKDRAFVLYDIKSFAKQGSNEIVVYNKNFDIFSGIEAVYLVGDFIVAESLIGDVLLPEPKNIPLGDWTKLGYPYYSGKMVYKSCFESSYADCSAFLVLDSLMGIAYKISVNSKEVTTIGWPPYRVDISKYIIPGKNEITVTVMNSLQNLLGPHTKRFKNGLVTPGSFYLYEPITEFDPSGFFGDGKICIVL